jgi:hypothetical protein
VPSNVKKSISKVLLLITVYSLHLLFIERLMALPNDFSAQTFKDFFQKHHSNHYPHPPATDYYSLHKHDNKQSRSKITLPEAKILPALTHTILSSTVFPSSTHRRIPVIICRVADDTLERYRIVGSLLI